MIKKRLSSHWFWFVTIISLYSAYDIYEHISRPESIFEEHFLAWTVFTIVSQIVFFCVLFGSLWLIKRLVGKDYVITDILGIVIPVATHVYFVGPIVNNLVFPYEELIFFFKPILPGLFIALYLLIRAVIYLLKKSSKTNEK